MEGAEAPTPQAPEVGTVCSVRPLHQGMLGFRKHYNVVTLIHLPLLVEFSKHQIKFTELGLFFWMMCFSWVGVLHLFRG